MELAEAILKALKSIELLEERLLHETDENEEHLETLISISKNIAYQLTILNKNLSVPVAVNATITFGTPTNQ
jgi:hypothetical protein